MGLGERLRKERERLGLSQDAFSNLVGKSRKSQIRWEQDQSSPDIEALSVWARSGVDVGFVLTGDVSKPFQPGFDGQLQAFKEATQAALAAGAPDARDALYVSRESASGVNVLISPREAALITSFRKIPEEGKRAVESTCAAIEGASGPKKEPAPRPRPGGPQQPSVHDSAGAYVVRPKSPEKAA